MSAMTNTPTTTTTAASGMSITALVLGGVALLLSVSTIATPTFLLATAGIVAIVLGFVSARRGAGSTGIWLSRLAVLTGLLTLVVLGIMASW